MNRQSLTKGCLLLACLVTAHCGGNGEGPTSTPPSPSAENPPTTPSAGISLCACLRELDDQGISPGPSTIVPDQAPPIEGSEDPHPDWTNVDQAVLGQTASIGLRHVLLVGDSLTYNNPTVSLCGWPTIKAGYVDATWQDVRDRPLWGHVASRVAIVMLGTNNALKGIAGTDVEMQQLFARLTAERLIVATPPPLQPPAATPPVVRALTEVQSLVLGQPYPAIDTRGLMDSSFYTQDGIHLTAQGYASLNPLIEQSSVCQ